MLCLATFGCEAYTNTVPSQIVTGKVTVSLNADTPTGTVLCYGVGYAYLTLMEATVTNISGDTLVLDRLRLDTVFPAGSLVYFAVYTDEVWTAEGLPTSPGELEIRMDYSNVILLPGDSKVIRIRAQVNLLESEDQMSFRITGVGITDEFHNDVGIQVMDVQGPVRSFIAALDYWSQANAWDSSSVPQSAEVVGRFLLYNRNDAFMDINNIRFGVYASDFAHTDWREGMEISLVNAKTGFVVSGPKYLAFYGEDYITVDFGDLFTLDPQGSMDLLVVANTMGASQVLHDELYVMVMGTEFSVYAETFTVNGYTYGPFITYVEESGMPEISATLAAGSPSGATIPGYKDELIFDLAATADATISGMVFDVQVTDNAGTGWMYDLPVWLYAAEDMNTPLGWACYHNGKVYMTLYQPVVIGSGEVKRFVLKADTSGASATMDDWEQFSLSGLFAKTSGMGYDMFTPTPVQGGVLVN